MLRTVIAAATLAAISFALVPASHAEGQSDAQERLLIVNGNSGHVIYDDGRNDLFCVTRRVVVGYTYWGRMIVRQTSSGIPISVAQSKYSSCVAARS